MGEVRAVMGWTEEDWAIGGSDGGRSWGGQPISCVGWSLHIMLHIMLHIGRVGCRTSVDQ